MSLRHVYINSLRRNNIVPMHGNLIVQFSFIICLLIFVAFIFFPIILLFVYNLSVIISFFAFSVLLCFEIPWSSTVPSHPSFLICLGHLIIVKLTCKSPRQNEFAKQS